MVRLTFPDGSVHEYADGVTGGEVAAAIGPRLAKAAFAAKVDGAFVDLDTPIEGDSTFEVVTEQTEDGRHVLRHSAAHIMAQAVLDLFPGAKFAIGPPITDGFYYDFEVEDPFTGEDLHLPSCAHWVFMQVRCCPLAMQKGTGCYHRNRDCASMGF